MKYQLPRARWVVPFAFATLAGLSCAGGHDQTFPPRGPLATTWDEAYKRMQPATPSALPSSPSLPEKADPSTLNGKVMCGYQGWFLAQGDSSGGGWVHYGTHGFSPQNCTVDLWPDMTEATPNERYPTVFPNADGTPASVFSSYNAETVNRHFQWMADYGIDGAFLQRFGTTLETPEGYDQANAVLNNVRRGAHANGRTWAVMYDLSGLEPGEIKSVIMEDWKRLVDRMQITDDSSYQHHQGKPVVSLWGIGFAGDRDYTLKECEDLIRFLKDDPKYGGNSVMVGVPYGWREQNRDAVHDPKLHDVILEADIVSPWTVGRYQTIDNFNQSIVEYPKADLAWCRQNNRAYMPVIFPGFRWHHLMSNRGQKPPYGDIDRLKGAFFRAQGNALIARGATMLYIAMFDEIDEGTAIFKCSNHPPPGADLGTFEGLPTDSYLRMAGEFSGKLKSESNRGSLKARRDRTGSAGL